MDSQLIAIRDGEYEKAIQLSEACVTKNPDDFGSHFTLAQAYESLGSYEKAMKHAEICARALPTSFEALSLAARCASGSKRYDVAYGYANRALLDSRDPNLPLIARRILMMLSYIPGLKSIRGTNASMVGAYTKQTMWLREYIVWYENQSPNK